jgi:hypothetical protein
MDGSSLPLDEFAANFKRYRSRPSHSMDWLTALKTIVAVYDIKCKGGSECFDLCTGAVEVGGLSACDVLSKRLTDPFHQVRTWLSTHYFRVFPVQTPRHEPTLDGDLKSIWASIWTLAYHEGLQTSGSKIMKLMHLDHHFYILNIPRHHHRHQSSFVNAQLLLLNFFLSSINAKRWTSVGYP